MGLTFARVTVKNLAKPGKKQVLKFFVDSGAVYSVVPEGVLKKLGIKARSKKSFTLANGDVVERSMGDALFEYSGEKGASPVIFGQTGDALLLGSVTLEALGLMLDPLRREIKPLPMVLGEMPR